MPVSNPTHTESVAVLYHSQISAGSYNDPGCLQIAKDFLVGKLTNYFLFQVRDGYYCLILSDNITSVSVGGSAASFSCEDATVYDIFISTDTTSQDLPFTGNGSGSYTGVSPAPSAGNWSGSLSGNTQIDTTQYYYYYTVRSVNTVSLYNPDNWLCYSSLDNYPKLVEGVTYYAFAAFVFAVAVVAFKLCNRIFSRVY